MARAIINHFNTIAHFKGNYTDDNRKPAKGRRHLSIEKKGDYLFFMKFTSRREELSQVKLIKIEPEIVECLDMVSYPVFNRKVKISLTDLKTNNYRHFYACSLHLDGCLKPKIFAKIYRKFKEIWEDKSTPESDKKIILLKASELKPTKGIPLMSRIHKIVIRRCRHCAKLRNFFLFVIFFLALLIILWVLIKLRC
ncbi:hypothetical protein [endosymbiont GvMRE of Glomus versiforme]|uniref:hypothetical protein n=1 Tax=endosymbiont GvMRE of Glomus versiforme TaxID=2039283 RepID=UPI000EDDF22C|nr:hypothetical protein [endosymbiont GvMRE of Glomus versiforme]RHZ37737.1 hypothetical protein GvMRE_I1g226 [endosymbiont GvMRE of Glomus versiforme]